jgi:hypothetical protein
MCAMVNVSLLEEITFMVTLELKLPTVTIVQAKLLLTVTIAIIIGQAKLAKL